MSLTIPKKFRAPEYVGNLVNCCWQFVRRAQVQPRIPRTEYARSIVIPTGQFAGQKYRPERQPVSHLILQELDLERWTKLYFMWSVQSGKSFAFVDVETCYIAEILKENQIIALPDEIMLRSKWNEIYDIFEMKGSGYLLPKLGSGTKKGSAPSEVRFSNGAQIRFMTSGSSDSGRSGYTARHVCIDEIDKQTKSQSTSAETTPDKQYEARMASFPAERRRLRGTSTIGEETGFLWQTHVNPKEGSFGHVVNPCPRCGKYVFLERKNLKGWQDASNVLEAMKLVFIACPECNGQWTESERRESVKKAVIAHRGQTVDENGVVLGPLPEVTIGTIRATGFHDIIGKSIQEMAAKEFLSRAAGNPEDKELELNQFYFVIPKKSKVVESVPLTVEQILAKPMAETRRYRVPENAVSLVVGVDMHSEWLQCVVIAELEPKAAGEEGNFVVIDHFELDSGVSIFDKDTGKRRLTTLEKDGKQSWFLMLDRLFDRCFVEGWELGDRRAFPNRVYIDSRYNKPQSKALDDTFVIDQWIASLKCCRFVPVQADGKDAAYSVCRFCNQRHDGPNPPTDRLCAVRTNPGDRHTDHFRMVMGVGQSERDKRKYANKKGPGVVSAGDGWHQVRDQSGREYWIFDADRSKLKIQNRFFREFETPGTMLLYRVNNAQDHNKFGLSITAKVQTEEKGKIVWNQIREHDHCLDAAGIAGVGLEIEAAEILLGDIPDEVLQREIDASKQISTINHPH